MKSLKEPWLKENLLGLGEGYPHYDRVLIIKSGNPLPKNIWFACEDIFPRKCDMPHCNNSNLWFRLNDDGTEWFLCEGHGLDEGTIVLLE